MTVNPACVAYEAYRSAKNADPSSDAFMLGWEHLSRPEKKAWWEVIRAISGASRCGKAGAEPPLVRDERDSKFLELRANISKLLDEYAASIPPTRDPIPDLLETPIGDVVVNSVREQMTDQSRRLTAEEFVGGLICERAGPEALSLPANEELTLYFRSAVEVILENCEVRRCFKCGNTALHRDNVTPYVLCKKCGSQDTRLVKRRAEPSKK